MPKLSLVFRISLAFLLIFVPLKTFDQWLYDRISQLNRGALSDSPYVLIRVSEGKLAQSFEDPPPILNSGHALWKEAFYSPLLQKLSKTHPKLVIFTSFFNNPTETTSLRVPYPILFSSWLDQEGKLVPPLPPLSRNYDYGFNNLFPDPDNVIRQAYLVRSSVDSLALKAHQLLGLKTPEGDLVLPIHVAFGGPSGAFPSFDAWDILEPNFDTNVLKDKILFIGREGSPWLDVETPFGKMSHLEVQANVVRTFLEDREIRYAGPFARTCFALISVIVSVFIVLFFPLSFAWFLLVLIALSFGVVSWASLVGLRVWIGLANPLLCILGTHLLLIGFKLSREEEQQWRIREEAKYLKEMDQFKNNFVSLFSHDLKTPIAKIKAITDRVLTENPDLPLKVSDGFQGIERANNELARLISDILRVTKMETMPLDPAREVLDINRLIESAVQRLRFLLDEKHITLVQDLEPLFSMEGDPQLLLEVITNLIENAIKYSPPQSKVVVQTRESQGKVTVTVKDQGPGIPPEELPRVTSKFYRGKTADKTTKGSGLGLYLAKYFVELHGGTLNIRSELQGGTEVSFTLPIS